MATARELIQRGMVAVRNSATLYPEYQNLFNQVFGYFPECPTCGSLLGQNQWKAFAAFAEGADPNTLLTKNTTETMSKQTFKIKDRAKLYSYNFKKKGQDRDFTSRTYGDVMTEEFAIGYLDSASEDEELLNQRKAEFSELPAKYAKKETTVDATKKSAEGGAPDLTKLKMADLQAIATEKTYPVTEWEKLNSKANMIAYLEAKALLADTSKGAEGGAPDPAKDLKPEGDVPGAKGINDANTIKGGLDVIPAKGVDTGEDLV